MSGKKQKSLLSFWEKAQKPKAGGADNVEEIATTSVEMAEPIVNEREEERTEEEEEEERVEVLWRTSITTIHPTNCLVMFCKFLLILIHCIVLTVRLSPM